MQSQINFNRNYASIVYHFQDIASYLSKFADFNPPVGGDAGGFSVRSLASETLRPWAIVRRCLRDPVFSGYNTIRACDGRTDRQTDGHTTTAYTALA